MSARRRIARLPDLERCPTCDARFDPASLDELIRVGVELVPGFKLAKMLGRGA